MRTSLFLITGFLLLGVCVLLAKLFSPHYADASGVATTAYVVLWLIIAAFNMWVGVAKAGYSVPRNCPSFFSSLASRQQRQPFSNGSFFELAAGAV